MKGQKLLEIRRMQKLAGILKEEEVIDLDTGGFTRGEKYMDAVMDYIDETSGYYNQFDPAGNESEVEALLEKKGKLLFIIYSEGNDPESDGAQTFYSLEGNQKALSEIASIIAQNEEDLDVAAQVQKGFEPVFCIFKSLGSGTRVDPDASVTNYFTFTVKDSNNIRRKAKKLQNLMNKFPDKES